MTHVLMTCSAPALVRSSNYFRFADYSGVAVSPSGIDDQCREPVSGVYNICTSPNRMLGKNISLSAARRSEFFASAIYLLAFLALLLCAYLRLGLLSVSWVGGPYELAMLTGAGLLLLASILHFTRRTFADALALIGAILAWPCFWLLEFSGHQFSAWLIFNYPGLHDGVNPEADSIISVLDVQVCVLASISLLIFSVACSMLRLAPRSWTVRGVAIRDRILPAVIISLCLVAAWFLESVTPYRIPVYDRGNILSAVSILHAEKRGFHPGNQDSYLSRWSGLCNSR